MTQPPAVRLDTAARRCTSHEPADFIRLISVGLKLLDPARPSEYAIKWCETQCLEACVFHVYLKQIELKTILVHFRCRIDEKNKPEKCSSIMNPVFLLFFL